MRTLWGHWAQLDNSVLLISGSLTSSHLQSLKPWEVTYSQVAGVRMRTYLWAHYSVYHRRGCNLGRSQRVGEDFKVMPYILNSIIGNKCSFCFNLLAIHIYFIYFPLYVTCFTKVGCSYYICTRFSLWCPISKFNLGGFLHHRPTIVKNMMQTLFGAFNFLWTWGCR